MDKTTKIVLGVLLAVLVGGLAFTYLRAPGQKDAVTNQVVTMLPLTDSDWQIKATSSSVTFTEYADFQCPACAGYHPIVKTLREEYANRVTFAFRQFPLAMHQNAVPAASAAEAAGNQGKFFEMADILYDKQTEWSDSKTPMDFFKAYASTLGLDIEKFTSDMENPATKEKIVASYKEGTSSKVNATPTFFINGVKVSTPKGNTNEEIVAGFKKLIDDQLAGSTQ